MHRKGGSVLSAAIAHWYFISTWACPICGRENTIRERRYDERPEKPEDRHEYVEHWDGCGV